MTPTSLTDFIERGERGFARSDAWSLDTYLAGVIAGGSRELAADIHGCPPELVEGDDVEAGCDRWRAILAEIAVGFERWAEDEDRQPVDELPELARSFDLLRHWWGHLWD